MGETFKFKDTLQENRSFLNRIVVSVLFMMLASLVLVVRLVYLQVVGHEHYSTLSRDNQIKISPLAPARGLIFDRNGEVLADNAATYSLEVIPEQVGNLDHSNVKLGKAGRKRHMGIRPTVRGTAMSPRDHPHGGGEGRQPAGMPGPKSPWGRPTRGYKTRRNKKTNQFIVRRRNQGTR